MSQFDDTDSRILSLQDQARYDSQSPEQNTLQRIADLERRLENALEGNRRLDETAVMLRAELTAANKRNEADLEMLVKAVELGSRQADEFDKQLIEKNIRIVELENALKKAKG